MKLQDSSVITRIPMSHPDLKLAEAEAVRQVLLTHRPSIPERWPQVREHASVVGGEPPTRLPEGNSLLEVAG